MEDVAGGAAARADMPRIKTAVVAEIGNVHDGSLGEAYALVNAVAVSAADAVKFQVHEPEFESTADEQFPRRFAFHPQDNSRGDYWRRITFSREQWIGLCEHARQRDLIVAASAFAVETVKWLDPYVDWWKVASGEANNLALLAAMKETGKRIILSTGMSTVNEVDIAATMLAVPQQRERLVVLQCVTQYPTPMRQVGMNWVDIFCRNLCFLGGISDHSGTVWPGVIAAWLGAGVVEVHVCWDRRQWHPDVAASLTVDELATLVRGVRCANAMRESEIADRDHFVAGLADTQAYRQGKRRHAFDRYSAG